MPDSESCPAKADVGGAGLRRAGGDQRPVFMRRLSNRRLVVLDGVAGTLYTLFLLGIAFARPVDRPAWAVCLNVAAIGLPVAVRRLWPLPVFGVVFAATAVSLVSGPVREPFIAAALALYIVALVEPRRPREPTLLIGVVSAFFVLLATAGGRTHGAGGGYPPAVAVVGPAVLGGAWTVGRAVRERRVYAARAAERLAERAVTEERLRIARELHDVVSHTLSLIGVKAGVAGYLLRDPAVAPGDRGAGEGGAGEGGAGEGGAGEGVGVGEGHDSAASDPAVAGGRAAVPVSTLAEVRDTLRVIETTSREALVEMHHMLGVLRSGEASADPPPAPGVGALAELAERAAPAGVRVELTVRGAGTLPEGLGRSVYRIVQEAVTNVIRHAAPARCRVVVEADRTEVRVRVTDDGPGGRTLPGPAGHGIVGMRERALMHGGSLTAGPLPEGGFEVSARLPRRHEEAT